MHMVWNTASNTGQAEVGLAASQRKPTLFGRLSDQDARQMLEQVLDARRQIEAGGALSSHASWMITSSFEKLVPDIFEPIARHTKLVLPHEEFSSLSLNEKRAHIAQFLYLGLPVLQVEVRSALPNALLALNAGAKPGLFRKTVRVSGASPDLTTRAKLELLRWVDWQVGGGQSRAEAMRQVAAATNTTDKAVAKWVRTIKTVYGPQQVQHELKWAREVGRCQADGMSYADVRSPKSDRDFMLSEAWAFERDLAKLANELKKVLGKRIVPKA